MIDIIIIIATVVILLLIIYLRIGYKIARTGHPKPYTEPLILPEIIIMFHWGPWTLEEFLENLLNRFKKSSSSTIKIGCHH